MTFRQGIERAGQAVEFAFKAVFDDLDFGIVENVEESGRKTETKAISAIECGLAARIDEEAIHQIEALIARGAGDGPTASQALMRPENFFDEEVERPPI